MGFVGVIDSGVGGLTVLNKLRQRYNVSFTYVADHAFCPYGTKSNEIVYSRADKLVSQLKGMGADAVVLACNTMSVYAECLSKSHGLPVYDVITPTCGRITANTAVRRVALLATRSTIANGLYQSILAKHGIETMTFDCSEFVPFVEQRTINTIACQQTVNKALRGLATVDVDAVILGCTHFPLVRRQIAYYCDDGKIAECDCDLPESLITNVGLRLTTAYFTTGNVDFANNASGYFENVKFKRLILD